MEYYKEVGNVIYTYDELLALLKTYIVDESKLELIKRAYLIAKKMHVGQLRKSGESYIIHPLNVAYIAAQYKLDYETICASILHDVVEDTDMSLDELGSLFGIRISNLVDGVTKITNMQFKSKDQENIANQSKILHGMCSDVRIIFIKLFDRLHNMRTMSSMDKKKQILKAKETINIYVPLAYRYGLYRIKEELEDIALYYINKDSYNRVFEMLSARKPQFYNILSEMKGNILDELIKSGINSRIDLSIKNIHGVYRRLNDGIDLENMHDLLALKVIVPTVLECYSSLGIVHSLYNCMNERLRDYISQGKSNHYQSFHTVLFTGTPYLAQARIRTEEMNKFASSGIISYYQKGRENDEIRQELEREFSFFSELVKASSFYDNTDMVNFVKEQFQPMIKVYTPDGKIFKLPLGSTPLDLMFKLESDLILRFTAIFVNNRPAEIGYKLQDGDRLSIYSSDKIKNIPKSRWLHIVQTEYAKEGIKQLLKS